MSKPSRFGRVGIRMGRRASREDVARSHAAFMNAMKPYVATVVIDSFRTEGMRNPTMHAVKERSDYVLDLVKELRLEHKWSRQRIRDHLAYILRCRLAKIEVPLNSLLARSSW